MKTSLSIYSQRGFTIIELMIATTVLSTMLVLVTAVMISIGNLYYKGVNQARVQDSVRTITEEVSQDLELNSVDPVNPTYSFGNFGAVGNISEGAYCIGSVRYSYVIDVKIGDQKRDNANNIASGSEPTFKHILWRDTLLDKGCTPADLTANDPSAADPAGSPYMINSVRGTDGSELVPDNSRLTSFAITSSPITGSAAYNIDAAVAFGDNDLTNGINQGLNTACKGSTGDQFCATASLHNITATRRLQ